MIIERAQKVLQNRIFIRKGKECSPQTGDIRRGPLALARRDDREECGADCDDKVDTTLLVTIPRWARRAKPTRRAAFGIMPVIHHQVLASPEISTIMYDHRMTSTTASTPIRNTLPPQSSAPCRQYPTVCDTHNLAENQWLDTHKEIEQGKE